MHQLNLQFRQRRRPIRAMADSRYSEVIGRAILHVDLNDGKVSEDIRFVDTADAGTGIFAMKAIPARTSLICVPFKQCISVESVSKSALSSLIENRPGLMNYPDEVIAMWLMHAVTHMNDESLEWSHHIDTLPKTYNTPLFWSDEELNEIKGYNVCHLTNLMKKQIITDWDTLHQPLSEEYPEELGGCTADLYKWALSTIYSRAVGIHRNGAYTRCIPPVIDMANHDPEAGSEAAETLSYDEERDTVSFINNKPKLAGEECYAVYGNYSNEKLLYTYGFVILNNPNKAVDLWTRVTPTLHLASEKQAILSAHELTREPTYDFEGTLRPGYVSPALLATIRIVQADEAELQHAEAAFRGEMLSVRNEMASYVSLKKLLLNGMRVETAEVKPSAVLFNNIQAFLIFTSSVCVLSNGWTASQIIPVIVQMCILRLMY